MKYLIELITSWGYTQKYEVHDNHVKFTFRFGGGFQAILTNEDIEQEGKNWKLELFNTVSHRAETVATDLSLKESRMLTQTYEKMLKKQLPEILDNINLN